MACGAGIYEPLPDEEGDPFAAATTPAPIGLRVAARFIDTLITFVGTVLVLSAFIEQDADEQIVFDTTAAIALATMFIVVAVYEIVPTAMVGGTFGKLVMGVRVLDAELDGFVDLGTSVRRWVLFGVLISPALPTGPLIMLIGFLVLGSSAWMSGRGWPDRFAGTIVVRARKA